MKTGREDFSGGFCSSWTQSCRSLEAGYAWIDFGSLGGSNSLESLGRIWKSEGLEWSWRIKKLGQILGSEKLRKFVSLESLGSLGSLGSSEAVIA